MQPATATFSTYITPKEICQLLQIDHATLHRWTKKGKFPQAIKIGRIVRYKSEEIQTFLNTRTIGEPQKA